MSSIDDAFSIAQSLSPADQQILIERLLEALPHHDFRPPDSHLAEVQRRSAEYDAGRMEAYPWEEVRESVRRMISGQ